MESMIRYEMDDMLGILEFCGYGFEMQRYYVRAIPMLRNRHSNCDPISNWHCGWK